MKKLSIVVVSTTMLFPMLAHSAVALDRTRIVYPGDQKSISLSVTNQNNAMPYLAQGWLESPEGKKLEGNAPLVVLPPIQRLEPQGKGQLKIQATTLASQLPQDRESLYYFNLREVPPKSEKANVLQIALQTRIKLFYRPAALANEAAKPHATPFQEQIKLSKQGNSYTVNNPSAYYVTLIGASAKAGDKSVEGFKAVMVPPKSSAPLGVSASALGAKPVLTYVNDYGGQPELTFNCQNGQCQVAGKTGK